MYVTRTSLQFVRNKLRGKKKMNKKIAFGIVLLSILILVGCTSYSSESAFCERKGYEKGINIYNFYYITTSTSDGFFCYRVEGNKIITSNLFTPMKDTCDFYNKGDGCADN